MSETKIKKIKVSGVVHPLADEALEQVVQENSEVTAAALVEHESEINSIDEITAAALSDLHQNKQDALVSGTNIKTINGESILGSGDIVIEGGSGNIPTKVSELENDAGYTTNTGTITGITMNGASKGTSGVVDLGTVLTAHQDISGKENTSNKVTSITESSTDTQYPSAKAVYDTIQNSGIQIVELSKSQYSNLVTKNNNTLYAIPENITFAGYQISPGPVSYDGSAFVMDQNTHWMNVSYGVRSLTAGGEYFTIDDLGRYFDSSGSNFNSSSQKSIDNLGNKVSFNGYNDWRIPTSAEWTSIISTSRTGAIINSDSTRRHYAKVYIDYQFCGYSQTRGLLLFPDNVQLIVSRTLNYYDTGSNYTTITLSQLSEYVNQGCVFIPAYGYLLSNYNYNASYLSAVWTASFSRYDSKYGVYYSVLSFSSAPTIASDQYYYQTPCYLIR